MKHTLFINYFLPYNGLILIHQTKKGDTNYETLQTFFCGNHAVYDCLLHNELGALPHGHACAS
ncbi:MAG TPA: hypothetical protein VIQ00_07225 [Chitinophagaceae bacterium]